MANMTDYELLALISNAEQDAAIYNGEFSSVNSRLLKQYLQLPYGDEVKDQSKVVASDIQDVVESDLPSLARVFLGTKPPMAFEPLSDREDDVKEAEEKSIYINHLITEQPWSYRVLMSWIKDTEIQTNGVVKYFVEDTRKTKEVSFSAVDESELDEIYSSLLGNDVESVEAVSQTPNDDGTFDVSFKVTTGCQEYKIIAVPTDQFLVSKNASSIDDAELVGDKVNKTRGQLLSEGYKRSLIDQLPSTSSDENNTSEQSSIRNYQQGGDEDNSISNWANEKVEIRDLYVLVDYDGDGIAERRHILKSGNHILVNEAFDHVPYASMSGLLMPHQAIGRSRAQLVQQTQRVKTVIQRQMLNNMYMVNNPRNIVHPDVNIDDMLNVRANGLVRMKPNTQVIPQSAVMPLVTPYIGDKAILTMQYLDQARAQSTGLNAASQGLDAEAIANESATRFQGNREDSKAKIELVARTMAETGFRKLYEGMAWLVSTYQDSEKEIRVLGKTLTIDPKSWKYNHKVIAKIGNGSADTDRIVASMQGILGIQQQLQAQGSPLVDQVKLYNVLEEITKGLGFKQSDKFFNNPEQPADLLQAENEILKNIVSQLQQQAQSNPLAEAEQIKAQASLIQAQGKASLEAAKITEQVRQFDEKLEQEKDKLNKDLSMKLTELEAKYEQQLNAEFKRNEKTMLTFNPATGEFE